MLPCYICKTEVRAGSACNAPGYITVSWLLQRHLCPVSIDFRFEIVCELSGCSSTHSYYSPCASTQIMFVESVQKTTELTAYCLLQFILGLESINIFQ